MTMYPAYVHISDDGSASGFFLDVKGCSFATGPSEDILNEAKGALDAHFDALTELSLNIPPASNMNAALSIFHYIETYYNIKRLHSSLGWMSPNQFEALQS